MQRIPITITRHLLVHDAEHSKIKVKITIPGPEEECPLTLNPIQNDEVSFLPGIAYSKTYTNHKKMTLPCNHSFGAMTLLYHFARNKMECPLCRAGKAYRLDTRSIPLHFRRAMLNQIREADMEHTREENNHNDALAREIFQHFVSDLNRYLTHIYMTVYLHVDNQVVSLFRLKMIFVVRAVFGNATMEQDAFHFGLTPEQRRTIVSHIHDLGLQEIALGFSIQDGTEEPREISRSDPFPVSYPSSGSRSIPCTLGHLATTDLTMTQNGSQFRSLCWSISADDLLNA